jgi:hypothetical protein
MASDQNWDFVWNDFWWTFKGPGQPLLIAASWWFAGGESVLAWQVVQTLLLFTGQIWLAREIHLLTRQPWLGIALLWVVTLSKSSVFWTLKYAQETTSEAMTYLCIAGGLWALRKPTFARFAFVGALFGFAILCRPQCAIYVLLFPVVVVVQAIAARGWRSVLVDRRLQRATSVFACGVVVVWAPWGIRSFILYDALVPLTTQGPYAVLWELGDQRVEVPGYGTVSTDIWPLLHEAPKRFTNDYEASRYANAIAWAWIKTHRWQLPEIVGARLIRSVTDDGASGLTRVSRTELLPSWWNGILLDKDNGGYVVIIGIVGLVLVPIRWGAAGLLVPAFVLLPWIATASLIGWARYFEPSLPMVLFGNVVFVSAIPVLRIGLKPAMRRQHDETPLQDPRAHEVETVVR